MAQQHHSMREHTGTIVDVHTHVYPPSFVSLLRERTTVPFIRTFDDNPTARLVILPTEDDPSTPSVNRGRPIGPEYYDIDAKLAFMDAHHIDVSVISLANPWLDWLPANEAASTARKVNDDVEALCAKHPDRLFAFGTLPLSGSSEEVVAEIERLKTLEHMRGVIIGTSGLGKGLDDAALNSVWAALERTNTLVFLHPHYGLPSEVYGPLANNYGHVLPLALGFPLETTIAVARMFLAGVWERFQGLEVLLAHSGGTLPFLAGRIQSCIAHDAHMKKEDSAPKRSLWEVLKKNIYLDAVVYGKTGLEAAIDASGADRLMFGTDHPFFPPLDEGETQWLSVNTNKQAVARSLTQTNQEEAAGGVMGGNAIRVLNLPVKTDKQ